jgi:hypothetical protein
MDRSSTLRGGSGREWDGEGHRKVILLSEYRQKKHLGYSDDDPPGPPAQAAKVGFANQRICSAVAGRPVEL